MLYIRSLITSPSKILNYGVDEKDHIPCAQRECKNIHAAILKIEKNHAWACVRYDNVYKKN